MVTSSVWRVENSDNIAIRLREKKDLLRKRNMYVVRLYCVREGNAYKMNFWSCNTKILMCGYLIKIWNITTECSTTDYCIRMYLDLHLVLGHLLVGLLLEWEQFGLGLISGVIALRGGFYHLPYVPLTAQQLLWCVCVWEERVREDMT